MILIVGVILLVLAFSADIPKSVKIDKRAEILKKNSHPECEWHIRYIMEHWCDDEGKKVLDVIRENTYFDEKIQMMHNCTRNEAVYILAKGQCARHGVPFGMTEALYLCPNRRVQIYFKLEGIDV